MTNEEAFVVLREEIESFSEGSAERESFQIVSEALAFIMHKKARIEFAEFIENKKGPLTEYEFIQLKGYGLSIPERFRSEEIVKISLEVDAIIKKFLITKSFVQMKNAGFVH